MSCAAQDPTDMHPPGKRGFCVGTAAFPGKLNVRRAAERAAPARPHTAGGGGSTARNMSWVRPSPADSYEKAQSLCQKHSICMMFCAVYCYIHS